MLEILKDKAPVWVVITLVAIYGFMLYGPKFIKSLMEVRHEMAKHSPTYLKEYITLLEMDREDAKKENEQLKKEVAFLRSMIKNDPNP